MELETLAEATVLKIDHAKGEFVSFEKSYSSHIEGIPLGLVQQRVFWPPRESVSRTPLCKSNDAEIGYPSKDFPFTADDSLADAILCKDCIYKRSYKANAPFGENSCSNSWVIIFLMEGDVYNITFSGAALREVGKWVEEYARSQSPLFYNHVGFNLTVVKRNDKRYSELNIDKLQGTDEALWLDSYLPLYQKWRDILETPPRSPAAKSAGGLESLTMN